jgi:hypothetical protein
MKRLTSIELSFFAVMAAYQAQACFTPEFQGVWDSYAHGELAEEYALYRRFLADRCERLSEAWARCCSCSFRKIQIGIIVSSMPQFSGLQMSGFLGDTVTFNIGWFIGGKVTYPGIAAILELFVRPLIRSGWWIDVGDDDASLLRQRVSVPIPSVTFLHELTHLLLRMDFILSHPQWTP